MRLRAAIGSDATAWVQGFLIVALLASVSGCGRAASATVTPDKTVRVRMVKAARREVVRKVLLPGTVRADLEVTLYCKITGFVKTMTKDRGDRVKAGELVSLIEIPEMSLELEHARASYALEDATFSRLEAIRKLERTAVTDQDMDLARAKRAMAQATLQRLKTMLDYTEIRAPFDGYVTDRFVDPGAFIQQGRLLSMVNASTVRVLADVPEREVRFMKVGTRANVRLDALDGKCFEAKVSRTSNALDPSSKTLRVEIDLPNQDLAVLPGMYAQVSLQVEHKAGAIVVPSDAVITQQDKRFIYVSQSGRVKKIELSVGIVDDSWTEALKGLSDGELIILPGAQVLAEGLQVQPTEGS